MAKKRKRSGGGGRRRKSGRGRKAVISLSGLIVLLWLLERIGVLSQDMWNAIMSGNFANAIFYIQRDMKANFTGAGVSTTIAGGVTLALVLAVIKLALGKGGSVPLTKPKGIRA